ncbi:MAG: hypothetical protein IKJ16_06770 [Agathobacter sp.]|nr:hypothetical protein [Agathobacter sp.]
MAYYHNKKHRRNHDQQEARELYRERRERENRESHEGGEPRENRELRENREPRENRKPREERGPRENREHRENREPRENQAITTFTLGEKELEGKKAQFQYDKGWYSIVDIVEEEKSVVYKSKNAQEAYTKWNVYIGRKKERLQRSEKAE